MRRRAPGRYGWVLVLLCTAFVLSGVTAGPLVRSVVALLYVTALVLAWTMSRPDDRLRVPALSLGALALVVTPAAQSLLPEEDAVGVSAAVLAVVVLLTAVRVVEAVLRAQVVTLGSVAAAISTYLLIGVFFTCVLAVMVWLQAEPVMNGGEDLATLQYFSFTTLTTVGYGDVTAATAAARSLATFEALVGQVFLATLVASLVANLRRRGRDQDGPEPPVEQRPA